MLFVNPFVCLIKFIHKLFVRKVIGWMGLASHCLYLCICLFVCSSIWWPLFVFQLFLREVVTWMGLAVHCSRLSLTEAPSALLCTRREKCTILKQRKIEDTEYILTMSTETFLPHIDMPFNRWMWVDFGSGWGFGVGAECGVQLVMRPLCLPCQLWNSSLSR